MHQLSVTVLGGKPGSVLHLAAAHGPVQVTEVSLGEGRIVSLVAILMLPHVAQDLTMTSAQLSPRMTSLCDTTSNTRCCRCCPSILEITNCIMSVLSRANSGARLNNRLAR